MSSTQIRISESALRAWREALGVVGQDMENAAVVNAALRVAADAARTDKEQGWHDAVDIVLDKFRDFAWKKGLAQERELAAADMEKLVEYEGREKSQDYKQAMADVVRPFFKMLKNEPSSGN